MNKRNEKFVFIFEKKETFLVVLKNKLFGNNPNMKFVKIENTRTKSEFGPNLRDEICNLSYEIGKGMGNYHNNLHLDGNH